jgi:hypothetical protein
MSPTSTEEITNRMVSVRATIIASTDAQIDEDSISFSLDNRDISDRIKINKISQQEYNLIYQPEVDLDTGLHKAEISFSDTEGLEADKSWNFTIQGEEEGTEDIYNIFGYEIAKNIVHIIGIGVLTVILALVTPFIIFSIWKDDKEEPVKNTKLPPTTPTDSTKYIEEEVSEIEDKVQTVPEENNEDEAPQEEDIWDKYSAPKPTQVQESQEEVQDEKESSEQEQPSTQTIEEQPQPKQEQDTPDIQPSTEDINVEETPQKEQPQVQSPPPVEQPESTPESKPEPTPETKPEVKVEIDQQPEEKEPERQEPAIPEPEIPEITELENLSKQLQKIKEEEQQEKQPSENTQ